MRGDAFSPSTSQMALPNAFAPPNQSFHSGLSHFGGTPQWEKSLRLMKPAAPSCFAYSPFSSLLTTATARPPAFATSCTASDPSPPLAPQTSTTSPGSTVCGGPAEQHAVGGGAGEGRRRRLLPAQEVGLGQALVRLHLAELRERPPAGVVTPDAEAAGEPRVLAGRHPWVVEVPLAGVHDDTVADLHVRDRVADGVDHPGGVGADDVEVGGLVPPSLGLRDVDRDASGRPHVVEVHAGRHDHHERVVRAELGHVDHLVADRLRGLAVAIGAHELRVHLRRHLADRWDLAELVQVLAHGSHPSWSGGCASVAADGCAHPTVGPPVAAATGERPTARFTRRMEARRPDTTAARGHHEQ